MYDSKSNVVRTCQLRTNELILPFSVTHNAVPASKTVTDDNPSVLYLKLQGLDYTTVANGGFDTSAEAAAITFATATDTTGVFSCLIKISEPLAKVLTVELHQSGQTSIGDTSGVPSLSMGTAPTGSTAFITSVGDKIVANFADSALNFATTDFSGFIRVVYTLTKY